MNYTTDRSIDETAVSTLFEAQGRIRELEDAIRQAKYDAHGAIYSIFGPELGPYVSFSEAASILRRRESAQQGRGR
jgi:hypothetical protein